ncbi:hypothetical protein [Gilvimarinus agarilyticus]|uniref:hypothetical protein n=1 Tax=Gilvimarinus agarilyticus TaxID=679259 RepID=UPI0005A14098|nr:hypothetical protein [Gilvimarinus agarilyticus]
MGHLVKGTLWAKETFEKGSRPTPAKIIKWIDSGEIPGRLIDGVPYVDADRFAVGAVSANDAHHPLNGLDLLA